MMNGGYGFLFVLTEPLSVSLQLSVGSHWWQLPLKLMEPEESHYSGNAHSANSLIHRKSAFIGRTKTILKCSTITGMERRIWNIKACHLKTEPKSFLISYDLETCPLSSIR